MLDIACHFYFFIIPTSILNTSLLTNTKSKPTQVRNIDPINHTVLCLLMDSNIIWFALRTRCHFCYFCSFWSGNFVSGWHIQKTYNDTFPIAQDAADIMIWVTPTCHSKDCEEIYHIQLQGYSLYSVEVFQIHDFDVYQQQNIQHIFSVYHLLPF